MEDDSPHQTPSNDVICPSQIYKRLSPGFPKTTISYPVFLNIGGLHYETRYETLLKFPDTLLGNPRKLSAYYCPCRNEYYFDRHRESFSSILFFYQSSGRLCRPENINLKVFLDECAFFEIPIWAVNALKRKEGGFLQDDIIEFLNPDKVEKQTSTIQLKLWNFFEDPSTSKHAKYFAYFAVSILFVSITINCLKTLKGWPTRRKNSHSHDIWEIIDIVINTYFLVEFVVRVIVSPRKLVFFRSVLVWIDFIALISFIPAINTHYANDSVILFFTPFQLFRVVRIFRLAKLLPEYNIAEIIVNDCIGYLRIFLTWTIFVAMVSATILYCFEEQVHGSTINSVFDGFYWAIQTFMTIGYGDVVPVTSFGKLFATFFILSFVPTLCMPTLTVLIRFSKFYELAKIMAEE